MTYCLAAGSQDVDSSLLFGVGALIVFQEIVMVCEVEPNCVELEEVLEP